MIYLKMETAIFKQLETTLTQNSASHLKDLCFAIFFARLASIEHYFLATMHVSVTTIVNDRQLEESTQTLELRFDVRLSKKLQFAEVV